VKNGDLEDSFTNICPNDGLNCQYKKPHAEDGRLKLEHRSLGNTANACQLDFPFDFDHHSTHLVVSLPLRYPLCQSLFFDIFFPFLW